MRVLTPTDMLSLWEQGDHLHAIDRAIRVLASVLPERNVDDLMHLPLGPRDSLLLAVRRACFGDRMDASDVCPSCGEQVETELSCNVLAEAGSTPPQEWLLEHDKYRVTLRPLSSVDAAIAAQCPDVEAARTALLACSIVTAERDGKRVPADQLPAEVASSVAGSLEQHDSGAELLLKLNCPECGHAWCNVLDVASFVWTEIAARARRLLLGVHTLARAYGWREADILTMSEARRAAYLSMVNA